jgi:hypothetical protein
MAYKLLKFIRIFKRKGGEYAALPVLLLADCFVCPFCGLASGAIYPAMEE